MLFQIPSLTSFFYSCLYQWYVSLSLVVIKYITNQFGFDQPVSQIWRLQMPIRRKFAVSSIFLLGAL